jgi:hypothetical protein
MSRTIFLLLAASLLAGCGGIADSTAKHQLAVEVIRNGKPFENQAVRASIRTYSDLPFRSLSPATTDTQGWANFEFQAMWSAALVIIPPLGFVPPRAPKPDYLVFVAGRDQTITPKTSKTTYRWREGGWHTEATVTVP